MNSCFCASYCVAKCHHVSKEVRAVTSTALDQLANSSLRRFAELGNGGWGGETSHVRGIDL